MLLPVMMGTIGFSMFYGVGKTANGHLSWLLLPAVTVTFWVLLYSLLGWPVGV